MLLRSNPSIKGISYHNLKRALDQYEPDARQYLGGTREIFISGDREIELVYLRRCLRSDENEKDWIIIYLAEELQKSQWFKIIIR